MKITLPSIIIFLVLVATLFAWIGFAPASDEISYAVRHIQSQAWQHWVLLFIAGAGTACFGDKEYGMFPPTSLRWLYVLSGIVLMLISAAWMHSLKTAGAAPLP